LFEEQGSEIDFGAMAACGATSDQPPSPSQALQGALPGGFSDMFDDDVGTVFVGGGLEFSVKGVFLSVCESGLCSELHR
jgi:hypothetical protein